MAQAARRPVLFPTLAGARWALADLDALSRLEPAGDGPNPLLDPGACDRFVRAAAARLGADFTYGGHGEDRSHLWRGHYLRPGHAVHLGIDLNVPAGTPVVAPAGCSVARVFRDPDRDGGWGGLVVLALEAPWRNCGHLALGHLAHAGLPAEGDRLPAGAMLGTVGTPEENGTWFPHLHVQAIDALAARAHAPRYERMDGYGAPGEIVRHPDPTDLVTVPA